MQKINFDAGWDCTRVAKWPDEREGTAPVTLPHDAQIRAEGRGL